MRLIAGGFSWLFDSKRIRITPDVGKGAITPSCSPSEDVKDGSMHIQCDIFCLPHADNFDYL